MMSATEPCKRHWEGREKSPKSFFLYIPIYFWNVQRKIGNFFMIPSYFGALKHTNLEKSHKKFARSLQEVAVRANSAMHGLAIFANPLNFSINLTNYFNWLFRCIIVILWAVFKRTMSVYMLCCTKGETCCWAELNWPESCSTTGQSQKAKETILSFLPNKPCKLSNAAECRY